MNTAVRWALKPLSEIFGGAVALRGRLYETGVLKTEKVAAPVVAVGNITYGGTGKTAVVNELLRWAREKNLRAGVVSRGYGRRGAGVARVSAGPEAAEMFGDEPAMLATHHPEAPIYVGARRVEAAKALLAENKVDFILADDAFQHRALHRDLNVVLVDATEDAKEYALIPSGRAREPLSALKRADFILLTKSNLASTEHKSAVKAMIAEALGGAERPVIECEYSVETCASMDGKSEYELRESDRVFLVSALAKPRALRATLERRVRIVGEYIRPDHFAYAAEDAENILAEARRAEADYVLTTEKDAVKLRKFPAMAAARVTRLEPRFAPNMNLLYDAILRLAR